MKAIVERNPLQGAPMEPIGIATVRLALRLLVCMGLGVVLILLLISL